MNILWNDIKWRALLKPKIKEPKIEIISLAVSLSFVRLVKVVQNRVWTTTTMQTTSYTTRLTT